MVDESTSRRLWRIKLAARTHDPVEKALVLLRDPAGHEGGTVRSIWRLMREEMIEQSDMLDEESDGFVGKLWNKGMPSRDYAIVKRADWWASAADRPQFPRKRIEIADRHQVRREVFEYASWAQVRWTRKPVLKHPLSADEIDLKTLAETDIHSIKERAMAQFERLRQNDDSGALDSKKTALALWRFGPWLQAEDTEDLGQIGNLWGVLPADTRVPDHTIWDHLDLVSAFAGAFAADSNEQASILSVSLGPVQSLIAASRTTSDLWAGSHLMSRLVWECMRPLVEVLGPDAVVMPQLRGIPQVDLWLRDDMQLRSDCFADCEWNRPGMTDANPLFAAALPNRFVAIVPADQAEALAGRCAKAVRVFMDKLGERVIERLLREAGIENDFTLPCYPQMRKQLSGFPELHWSVVPFSLIDVTDPEHQTGLDTKRLEAGLNAFYPEDDDVAPGFLGSAAWLVLQRSINWADGTRFFKPNPGVLYPAVHDLGTRALAATKLNRTFESMHEEGWRCSMTGETEWLTTDRAQLTLAPGQRKRTLWSAVAMRRPAWAKRGEHLGALPAVKRLWPTLFAEDVGAMLKAGRAVESAAEPRAVRRFVVSTHTMSLVEPLRRWMEKQCPLPDGWEQAVDESDLERVALPRKLVSSTYSAAGGQLHERMQELLGLRECAQDLASSQFKEDQEKASQYEELIGLAFNQAGVISVETYYGLLLFDGDRMGQWLSGSESFTKTYVESFHPDVRRGFNEHAVGNPVIKRYGSTRRATSPGRHLAISSALNAFSLEVARHVVEKEFHGRLLYAGGDDVMAMLPVGELLPASERLRDAFSGTVQGSMKKQNNPDSSRTGGNAATITELQIANGHVQLGRGQRKRLYRMMGSLATASAGLVVAHHQTPLSTVLDSLRQAEQRAKQSGGRNSFSISVLKRSGGHLHFTANWGDRLELLNELHRFLGRKEVSRRAAYAIQSWLSDIPLDDADMLAKLLAWQFKRQIDISIPATYEAEIDDMSARLANAAIDSCIAGERFVQRAQWLSNLLGVAEFLAREQRHEATS